MSYERIIEELFTRRFSYPKNLAVAQNFVEVLGHPERAFPSIHIAGTNGKGSVALKIAKSYEALGKKVGLYTSPHLFCYRERITINGKKIPEEYVERKLPILFKWAEKIDPVASFFELTTYLSFKYFAEEKVDIAILETGIGGLHDTTNVIQPLLSIVTSIGRDHIPLLGNTLEDIAFQKAGIIKPGIPVVLGPKANYPIMYKKGGIVHLAPNTQGFYDLENSSIARKALEVLDIPPSGLSFRPPCRFEIMDNVIFDVAHNPDGFNRLLEAMEIHFPGKPFAAAVGMSRDKDVEACLELLANKAKHIYLLQAAHPRAISVDEMAALLMKKGYTSFSNTLCFEDLLVVCGTFFIMKEVQRSLFRLKVGVE